MMTYPEITDEMSAEVKAAAPRISLLKIALAPRTDDAAELAKLGAHASLSIVITRQSDIMRPRNEIIGDGFNLFELMVDYENIIVVAISKDQRPYCIFIVEAHAPSSLGATEPDSARQAIERVIEKAFPANEGFVVEYIDSYAREV